jgi:hypothetical protein
MQIKELTPHMGPTSCFLNAAAVIQPVEAGVRIRLQSAMEAGQMPVRMFAAAIGRVSEPDRRSRRIASRAIVTNIRPQAAQLRFPITWRQHRDWGVVGMQFAPARTYCPRASTSGLSSSLVAPTQSASVERSSSTPSRAYISAWRYSGRWSAYLETRTSSAPHHGRQGCKAAPGELAI